MRKYVRGRAFWWPQPHPTLIRWSCTIRWLPSKKWQATCYIQKTKNLAKAVVVMKRKMNPHGLSGLKLQLSRIQKANYWFYHRAQFPGSPKTCFLAVSKLCKDTPKTCCTIPWEKKCQEVFWKFWHHNCYPHLVKQYCQVTSQQEVRDILLFQKTQNHDQSCCCHGRKMNRVFSGKFNTATIQLSVGKYFFLYFAIQPQFTGSQKHVFSSVSYSMRLPSQKKEAAHCTFRKLKSSQAVVMRRKVNQCAFLADLRLQ